MLILSRKIGEIVTIGVSVKVTVISIDRGVVKLGIEAPTSIPVHRKEIYDKVLELNRRSAVSDVSSIKNVISKSALITMENSESVTNNQRKLSKPMTQAKTESEPIIPERKLVHRKKKT